MGVPATVLAVGIGFTALLQRDAPTAIEKVYTEHYTNDTGCLNGLPWDPDQGAKLKVTQPDNQDVLTVRPQLTDKAAGTLKFIQETYAQPDTSAQYLVPANDEALLVFQEYCDYTPTVEA
jgi:hypothetical protein